MEFFVIWGLFGIAAGIVASNKGRSGCGFAILGFLLGPFGLLFALIARRDGEKRGKQRECPFCAESIKWEAIKCRFCGENIPPKPVKGERRCVKCGMYLRTDTCDSCGTEQP